LLLGEPVAGTKNRKAFADMSFLVVFNTKGAPIDPASLARNAAHVELLGRGQQVAFVQCRDDLTLCSEDLTQRVALSCGFWLIGRLRLDAREEICSAISGLSGATSDASICLQGYARWGTQCVDHFRGDFCFAIWDEHRQRLFCVRDQIGMRPLFYAKLDDSWFVSDSLELLARDASICNDLDEYWIADFLMYGFYDDPDSTVYKRIRRVAPGHSLTVSASGGVIQRYWNLIIGDPLYYSDPRKYIDHFREVVTLAIKDRLPKARVGISMSGGLDSTTLAAYALRAIGDPSKVVAHTRYFEYLMPHEEKHFSSLVASKLGILLMLRAIDEDCYDPRWYDRGLHTPEPNRGIIRAAPEREITAEMAEEAQVWFSGHGPDNALYFEWRAYLQWLAKKRDWLSLSAAAIQYIRSKEPREWFATIANYTTHRRTSERNSSSGLPEWINGELVKELQLAERVRQASEPAKDTHPWHPRAIANFTSAIWPACLENSGTPLSRRYPYLDLRVLSFLLSVPTIPWARRKRLMRNAMRGLLPNEVLSRDKAPLRRDPEAVLLQKHGLPPLPLDGPILRYIDPTKVPKTPPNEKKIFSLLNAYALDYWLKSRHGEEHLSRPRSSRPAAVTAPS
jgi:asparagine synthase (glutamine-hydrolysing)